MSFKFGNSYVRINNADDLMRLQDMQPEDSYYNYRQGETFARIEEGPLIFVSGWTADTKCLQKYSEQFTEVIYLGVQANVRIFVYEHWIRKILRRALTYSGDYGWVRVEGKPEKWEIQWFFSEIDLESELLCLQRITDFSEKKHRATQIRRVFHSHQIEVDAYFPYVNVESTAIALVKYFGFSI